MILPLKLAAYRFLSTGLGQGILKIASVGITAGNLKAPYFSERKFSKKEHFKKNTKSDKEPPKSQIKPFLIAITVDTESGYVLPSERRVWQKESPHAYQGYYAGIKNLREIFNRHKIKATFFLSTNCFAAKGQEYKKIIAELKLAIKEGHEIGLHLHPDSDQALQKRLGKAFPATSCSFYDERQLLGFITISKELIGKHLGEGAKKNIGSIRWGNWALDAEGARAIVKAGLKADSSATPGIKGHSDDGRKFDWSRCYEHYPWTLNTDDYQSSPAQTDKGNAKAQTLEMPIATFSFFGITLRADPQYSILLNAALDSYYADADRSVHPFPFVAITHSSEATAKDGGPTRAAKDLERFIIHAKRYGDVEFTTITDARNQCLR